MITLKNVTKQYEGRIILDVPELSFESCKRYALIGVNGCGKSTLLRLIAGVIQPDSGRIENTARESMGYMPQAPYAFSFSVQKNVEIALPKTEQTARKARMALEIVGLSKLASARGSNLSGGETQRMAFARMIARPHELLLLDEPTSAMDIRGTDQIENALLQYVKESGCTVIMSTHSPAQALRLAEEVIYLDQGKVIEQGNTQQVIENPQKESTRLFLQHWRL